MRMPVARSSLWSSPMPDLYLDLWRRRVLLEQRRLSFFTIFVGGKAQQVRGGSHENLAREEMRKGGDLCGTTRRWWMPWTTLSLATRFEDSGDEIDSGSTPYHMMEKRSLEKNIRLELEREVYAFSVYVHFVYFLHLMIVQL